MKKLSIAILTFLACNVAHALPLGNPSEASLLYDGLFLKGCCYDICQPGVSLCDGTSLRFGFYGDFVFNRHLEVDAHDIGDDIEDTELFTNAAYLALNFYNTIDIFSTLGASNCWISANAANFGSLNGSRFILETDTDFSWSIGARATFLKYGCTQFGVEGQYFYMHPHIKRTTVQKSVSVYPDHFIHLKYREWQIGFGVSHRIWMFVPYFGAKLSGVKVDFGDAFYQVLVQTNTFSFDLRDLKNRFLGGFVLGVSLIDCERMALTLETRFPDEKAVYVNGQLRY